MDRAKVEGVLLGNFKVLYLERGALLGLCYDRRGSSTEERSNCILNISNTSIKCYARRVLVFPVRVGR